jgi:hypothetical protein
MRHANDLMALAVNVAPAPAFSHSVSVIVWRAFNTAPANQSFAAFKRPTPIVRRRNDLLKVRIEVSNLFRYPGADQAFGDIVCSIVVGDD